MEAELTRLYAEGWTLLCDPVYMGNHEAVLKDVTLKPGQFHGEDSIGPKPFLLFLFQKQDE